MLNCIDDHGDVHSDVSHDDDGWLIDCASFLIQCFTNSSGVGRRKSW